MADGKCDKMILLVTSLTILIICIGVHLQVFFFINHQFAKTPLGPPIVKILGEGEPFSPPSDTRNGQVLPNHLVDSYKRLKDVVSSKYTFLREDCEKINLFLWIGCNVRHCLADGSAQADPHLNMTPVLTEDST